MRLENLEVRWLLVLIFASVWLAGESQNFRAAVAKRDITPEDPQQLLGYQARKSTGVHDKIYHRVVVLDDGENEFFLISSDICLISPSEYDRVKEMVTDKFRSDNIHFWWGATHTHSAPEVGPPGLPSVFLGNRYEHQFDKVYTDFVADQLIEGIEEARNNIKPAKLGVGWGFARANMNRRARDINGRTTLGMNPDEAMDRRIGLLKIVDAGNEELIALVANYAMHGTVMSGQNLLISGDAPGVVAEYVEEVTGAPMLYMNGAAGNLAPLYSVYPSPGAGHLQEFKRMLGDKIISGQEAIRSYRENISMKFGSMVIKTPRKKGLDWPSDLEAYAEKSPDGEDLVLLPISFAKIDDDVAIWSAPLELFCEISNEVRDRSPFHYTFYYGYTNGWLGYMLTEREWNYGGYELSVSPFEAGAGAEVVESTVSYLEGELFGK